MFFCHLDQSSAGIVLGCLDDEIRFWVYTTVDTTSAQYFSSILDSAIAEHVASRIVYILRSAMPFCWWAYGMVNWKTKPWSFLYCSQAVLNYSRPISSHSCLIVLPVWHSTSVWYDLRTFNMMSANFAGRNAMVLYDEKPSIIIMKYCDPPVDWVYVGPYMFICICSSTSFFLATFLL